MNEDKKGKQPTSRAPNRASNSVRPRSHSSRFQPLPVHIEIHPRSSIDPSSSISERRPTTHRPSVRFSQNGPEVNDNRQSVGSFSRDPSPLGQHVARVPFPGRSAFHPRESTIPEQSPQEDLGSPSSVLYPVDDISHPTVPDIPPVSSTGDTDTVQNNMNYNHYGYGSSAPNRDSSAAPPAWQAEDAEKIQLKAELEAYKTLDKKLKAADERKKREQQIREETEIQFQNRMEEIRKARESAKLEIERVKKEAETAAWERAEAARREQEAEKIRHEHQAKIMESEIRAKIEAERKAEEAEKMAKEKIEREMEMRLHAKMMEKVDDFMEVAKQRFLAQEMANTPQRTFEATQSPKKVNFSEHQAQNMNQYMDQRTISPSQPRSTMGYPPDNVPYRTPHASPSSQPRYPPSIVEGSCSSRPPSVPSAPDQSQYPDDMRYHHRNMYFEDHYPAYRGSPGGPTSYRPQRYDDWPPSPRYRDRGRMPMHPDLIQQLAYAVTEVLQQQAYNNSMERDDGPAYPYAPSASQASIDPREYAFAADRAAALEEQQRRRDEQAYRQILAQELQSMNISGGHNRPFDMPLPSPNSMPRTQRSRAESVVTSEKGSESCRTKVSAYQTPPQNSGNPVYLDPTRLATLPVAPMPPRETEYTPERDLDSRGNDGSNTNVNSSMRASVRGIKVEDFLSTAKAYMNRSGNR
ncbi:hypothetical protein FAUST_3105 [Fusarium austroamericanum]|uniref:Uncharacterized protein n=1 Tax=Fusarium austroamericanum TaxID=282268 RepID=A0AAN6C5G8_FUSAU|nr:hypothetical protein FAUST_3105 [Fusarium austroamericanum]